MAAPSIQMSSDPDEVLWRISPCNALQDMSYHAEHGGQRHGQQLPCLLPDMVAREQPQSKLRLPGIIFGSGYPQMAPNSRRGVKFALELASPVGSPLSPDRSWKNSFVPARCRRPPALTLTPSSCASASARHATSPRTPEPHRGDLDLLTQGVSVLLFDFDGTLTRTAGTVAHRCRRQVELELKDRSSFLAPRLQALREAGRTLGIVSKSTKKTILSALRGAGLADFFGEQHIIGSAVSLEGKAGIIEDMMSLFLPDVATDDGSDSRHHFERIALIDDDVRELERCRARGIKTYPAPEEGGLQEGDFDEIFARLALP